jgi:hypothetical protein
MKSKMLKHQLLLSCGLEIPAIGFDRRVQIFNSKSERNIRGLTLSSPASKLKLMSRPRLIEYK